MSAEDRIGRRVKCPHCGARQVAPDPAFHVLPTEQPVAELIVEPSVYVPADAPLSGSVMRKVGLGVLICLALATVAVVVAWPELMRRRHPVPTDPIVTAATVYLQALADGDTEVLPHLGTIAEPPAIRSFRDLHRLPDFDRSIKGSFAPLAALHALVEEKFEFDAASGRYKVRDPLGPAAETLDTLHEAKAKAEADNIYKKMASGDPNDVFDAAEGLGGAIARMAQGVLAPRKLVPTYKQVVMDAIPALSRDEVELALDYAAHRESWDLLLKRPFPTLKADGPFVFEQAELIATVRDRLASSGDPSTTLQLTLVRFRLEGIDTGWKIRSARRPLPRPAPQLQLPSASDSSASPLGAGPARPSPGEVLH